jgi:hypothetical protein
VDEIWRLGITFTKFLLHEHKGKLLFATGIRNRYGKDAPGALVVPHFEIGWCGQNIMNARMLVLEYLRTGEKKLLQAAILLKEEQVHRVAPAEEAEAAALGAADEEIQMHQDEALIQPQVLLFPLWKRRRAVKRISR